MSKPGIGVIVIVGLAAMAFGGFVGFFVGAAASEAGRQLLSDIATSEESADVANQVAIDRKGFEFKYPGNWTLDLEESSYDPEHYFFLDTPGGSNVEFSYEEDGVPPDADYEPAEDNLHYKLDDVSSFLNGAEVSYFEEYGSYRGYGAIVKGRNMGLKMTVRVFSYAVEERTIVITEYAYDEDLGLLKPGLDLIEGTLKVH